MAEGRDHAWLFAVGRGKPVGERQKQVWWRGSKPSLCKVGVFSDFLRAPLDRTHDLHAAARQGTGKGRKCCPAFWKINGLRQAFVTG